MPEYLENPSAAVRRAYKLLWGLPDEWEEEEIKKQKHKIELCDKKSALSIFLKTEDFKQSEYCCHLCRKYFFSGCESGKQLYSNDISSMLI